MLIYLRFILVFILVFSCAYKDIKNKTRDQACVDKSARYIKYSDKAGAEQTMMSSKKLEDAKTIYFYAGKEGCEDLTKEEIDSVYKVIERFGGKQENPYDYEESLSGLQLFLKESGVDTDKFSARELVTPYHQEVAKGLGYEVFIPKRCRWVSAVAHTLMAMEMRKIVDSPIRIRNWWRPEPYNAHEKVRGSENSDHIHARGFDLDFIGGAEKRLMAQKWLCDEYKRESFPLSVGIGAMTLHIGVGGQNKSTFWTYNFYGSPRRLSGDDCWNYKRSAQKSSEQQKVIYDPEGLLAI